MFLVGITPSFAAEKFCSDPPYFGVIDGNRHPVPTQITIDQDCTFQNYPADNPLTSTLNFQTNDPSIYLIVFNNVIFTGHMACANVDHRIWFANGSDYGSSNSCQDLFIPVESIDKQSPAASAAIGEPFTYTLTFPAMTLVGGPSLNDLHSIAFWDDLSAEATGADLRLLDINAYYEGSGNPVTLVQEIDPNAPGGAWTSQNLSYRLFSNPNEYIPAGEQIIVEITVVLEDTSNNVAGKTFVNTAKWSFGRLIEGVYYEPLPGEWGISQPMTISEPNLVVTKTSSETAVNFGVPVTYTIDVQNNGGGAAWDTTIVDELPAEMCDENAPPSDLSASIFSAEGNLISSLNLGVDYTANFIGGSTCTLTLTTQSDQAKISPNQHLLVTYQSQLTSLDTEDGIDLINVAGATRWFSANPDTSSSWRTYTRALTDGTPGVLDHQDSQVVTTALSGYYFQKTVENRNTLVNPATTAAPGDRLRYKVRLFNVDQTINQITISDQLDLNSFDPTTFTMISRPSGTNLSFNQATGDLLVTGDPNPVNVPTGEEFVVEFDINLKADVANNTEVRNQAELSALGLTALSDDPFVNGISPPDGDPPPDPTVITVLSPGPLSKANSQTVGTIGEQFTYTITVPAEPVDVPLYDVRILDNLAASNADLRFVRADVISGGNWTITNSGNNSSLVLEDRITGVDIPAGERAIIQITVELSNTTANQSGNLFLNSASYTYNRVNGDGTTNRNGGAGSTANMTVVEPDLTASKTVRFVAPAGKPATDPGMIGDVLEYVVTVSNVGTSTAFDTSIVDTLPDNVSLVPDSATANINGSEPNGFLATPNFLGNGGLAWGSENADGSLDIPNGQSLVLTYRVTIDAIVGSTINNTIYVDWSSIDGTRTTERTGAGCPSTIVPNDYCFGPVSVSLNTVDNTSITKFIVDDSYPEVPASSTDPVVRVGDTVSYELTINLHEFTTENVIVEDNLPVGMVLESFSIESSDNFTYVINNSSQPSVGATGSLQWDFGDITNAPSNDGTPIDPMYIRYTARVVTDDPPSGISTEPSNLLENSVTLSYTNGDPAVYPDRLTAKETADARQPMMSPISKVDLGSNRTGSGTIADPYQVNISADVMNFQLSSCNEGLAPAYGVAITDQLDLPFDFSDLATSSPRVTVGARTLSVGTDYLYTAPTSNSEMTFILTNNAPVNPGECVTVSYDIGFQTNLTSSETWSNLARLNEYWSLPSQSGRQYTPSDLAEIWLTNLVNEEQLIKTLMSSSSATIGDVVTYQIRVPAVPMNQALTGVEVFDTLNTILGFVDATAVDSNGDAVNVDISGQDTGDLTMGVGNIPAGDQVIITVTARIKNTETAQAGDSFTNMASYRYVGIPDDLVTSSTSGPVTVVEPSVSVGKSVNNLTSPSKPPNPGDILLYTLSFTAAGGAAGDSFSNAFDLTISDSLGQGLVYQEGTATVAGSGNTIADPVIEGDGISVPQSLSWGPVINNADIDVAEGTTISVTYHVLVTDSVEPGQELTNSASAQWTGQDGGFDFERTGSGTPEVNDYFTGPVTTTLIAELDVSFIKHIINCSTATNNAFCGDDFSFSSDGSGDNARPGDRLRYKLVISNESLASLTNASLIDVLAYQFAPGTLNLVYISEPSADISFINDSGGVNARGIVDIRNINLSAQGGSNNPLTIVFDAILEGVIDSGSVVLNQAQLSGDNLSSATSNETATLITSAPMFEVWKTSQDLTDDPAVLLPGDIMRYSITVQNIGNENAVKSILFDQIPVNTTYVDNSTTLNGNAVPDPSQGVSALQAGIPIFAPGNSSPGTMDAVPSDASSNMATVTFDVVINADVVEGTIIANQAFFNAEGAGSGPVPEEPSDDPSTPIINDPTRDVVGNVPLIDAHKTVVDENGGSVQQNDVLTYTINITNTGSSPATGVVFIDAVPFGTTYVAGSVELNGNPVADQTDGSSPLIAGIDISSADLTPSLPNSGNGTLSPDALAEVTFQVRVNADADPGTIISNQGVVASNEQNDEPTDADGIDANGDQPTQVVVGDVPQLSILKEVSVVEGATAEPGLTLEYLIRATNFGTVDASNVVVTDDLSTLSGQQVTYVANSALLNGSVVGVTFDGTTLTADYSAAYGNLSSGETLVLQFRVLIGSSVPYGTTLTNTAIVQWGDGDTAEASVSLGVGGSPGSAALNGRVWHDANLNSAHDSYELDLSGWTVELYRDDQLIGTVQTDLNGAYRLSGLNSFDSTYEILFIAAGAGPNTASLGHTVSPFTNGPQRISEIVVSAGSNLQGLNLPITPNGVVYDSVQRTPLVDVKLALVNDATDTLLPGECFEDPAQQNQVTAADGFYKFDLNFSNISVCPSGGSYFIEVTPLTAGYESGPSQVIRAGRLINGTWIGGAPNDPNSVENNPVSPFSVPSCPGNGDDALPDTTDYCEISTSSVPQDSSVAPGEETLYYLTMILDDGLNPVESQAFNNHIPVDPVLNGAVSIRKTSPLINVTKGQLVPYTITLSNQYSAPLYDISIVDTFPAGFKYVEGSARHNLSDSVSKEPIVNGRQLTWKPIDLAFDQEATIQMLLIVGAGVSEDKYVNRVHAENSAGVAISATASATVRVIPDPTFDCTDVIGKVFDDRNLNGQQDAGEPGLPGVQVVTARGLIATTDPHGRYHITCAMVPDQDRGSNFILKLDDNTLPSGYRLTTENPRVQRATRGKMMKFNFGATIHRVVGLDFADGVFEPDTTVLRVQWHSKLRVLVEELKRSTAILRLSYLADVEREGLVRDRVEALRREISRLWDLADGDYPLTVETEVFWRRGGPR